MKPTEDQKRGTQIFEIKNVLIDHCMEILTPDKIDEIIEKISIAINTGPCSWAFK